MPLRSLLLLLALCPLHLWAGDGFGSANGLELFSVATTSGPPLLTARASESSATADERRPYRLARDDAAAFVASGGLLHGAYLEAALTRLRSQDGEQKPDDLQLALRILAGD